MSDRVNIWEFRDTAGHTAGTDLIGFHVEATDGAIGKIDKPADPSAPPLVPDPPLPPGVPEPPPDPVLPGPATPSPALPGPEPEPEPGVPRPPEPPD
ncbi:hypothetical protein [Kitasatospora sp. NPDC056731]|uniref:hypothetical protein n=1 Tax=Kitasatospora sp. NPDC056731 TaxID=3155422 RepID=UPI0034365365